MEERSLLPFRLLKPLRKSYFKNLEGQNTVECYCNTYSCDCRFVFLSPSGSYPLFDYGYERWYYMESRAHIVFENGADIYTNFVEVKVRRQ